MEAKRQSAASWQDKMSGWLAKSQREQSFPIGVVQEALQKICVLNADASKKEDKRNILNCIVGRKGKELLLEPLATHRKYDEVNETLMSIFAELVIRKALAEGLPLSSLAGRVLLRARSEPPEALQQALLSLHNSADGARSRSPCDRTSGVVCFASSFLRLHTHRYRRRGEWFELGDVRTSFV